MKFDDLYNRVSKSYISFSRYNLKSKYNSFNSKYFKNMLPKIPVVWANLKGVAGLATCKIITPKFKTGFGTSKYQYSRISPNSLKIQISNTLKRSEKSIDKILIHEMIHVYFMVTKNFDEGHGSKFQKLAKIISKSFGQEIPLVDVIYKTKQGYDFTV